MLVRQNVGTDLHLQVFLIFQSHVDVGRKIQIVKKKVVFRS